MSGVALPPIHNGSRSKSSSSVAATSSSRSHSKERKVKGSTPPDDPLAPLVRPALMSPTRYITEFQQIKCKLKLKMQKICYLWLSLCWNHTKHCTEPEILCDSRGHIFRQAGNELHYDCPLYLVPSWERAHSQESSYF